MLSQLVKFQAKLAAMRDDRGATAVETAFVLRLRVLAGSHRARLGQRSTVLQTAIDTTGAPGFGANAVQVEG
jgi:hypothetical protein